jgi:transcriptional regulator with XRE-family HTH domain
MLSKIERGERKPKREQVVLLAKVLSCDKNELLILWLADRVSDVLDGEYIASDALRIVEEEHQKYITTK